MKVLKFSKTDKNAVLLIDGFAFVRGDYCAAHHNLSVPTISISTDDLNSKIAEYKDSE
jgi:hypothetical protein